MPKKATTATKKDKTEKPSEIKVGKADKEKLKALGALTGSINKKLGDNTIRGLDSLPTIVPCIPSDLPTLDFRALRIGGLGKGVVMEMFGPTGGGKTTIALQFAAGAQRRGGVVAFVDQEQALNKSLAISLGCDLSSDKFLFSQPNSGEEGFDITRELIRSGLVDLIIFDSLAAVIPKDSLEKSPGESEAMGMKARLVSREFNKIITEVNSAENKPVVIFINQLRWNIKSGRQESTCGHAPKFYSSARINVALIKSLFEGGSGDDKGRQYGHRMKVTVLKNKFAPPFYSAELNLIYGSGLDAYAEAIDAGVQFGLIQQSGSWFDPTAYGLTKVQGAPKLREQLVENNEVFLQLRRDVVKKLKEEVAEGTPAPIVPPYQEAVVDYDAEIQSGWDKNA